MKNNLYLNRISKEAIINSLFSFSVDIRYAAIYIDGDLFFKQRSGNANSSSSETDKYEELIVNPTLLTLARQRGNIDCGGLRFVIIGYGSFYQLIREIRGGHISICLDKKADLINLPDKIFAFISNHHPDIFLINSLAT